MRLSLRSILPWLNRGLNVQPICAAPGCGKRIRTQADSGHPAPIQVGEYQYCSPACFAAGSLSILARVAAGYVVEMPRQPRLSLGLALLSKGYVSEDQLRSAITEIRRTGLPLETILLEEGWVNDKQLAVARGVQWGHPALGIEPSDKVVEANLPLSLLRANWAAPIHFSPEGNRLVLGFVHRVEHTLLQSIEQISGCRAEPCFITPTEFSLQIARCQALPGYEEVFSEHPADVSQIAGNLAELASEVSGTQARFTRCKSWIWVRVVGNRGTVDAISAIASASQVTGERFYSLASKPSEALG